MIGTHFYVFDDEESIKSDPELIRPSCVPLLATFVTIRARSLFISLLGGRSMAEIFSGISILSNELG